MWVLLAGLGWPGLLLGVFQTRGWTDVNVALGAQLWRVLSMLTQPCIVGGDFNMEAEELVKGLPWLAGCASKNPPGFW